MLPDPKSLSLESTDDRRIQAKWSPLILALMIVALLLRIVAAIVVERQAQGMGQAFLIEGDANGYWELGQKIAAGESYSLYSPPRQVLRVPGFPILLATSIELFGNNIFAARIVLAFVGAACCWLTFQLGRSLHTHRVGFWAALFVTINPLHIGNSVLILSESWFTFWMLISLIALVRLINGPQTCSVKTGKVCKWRLSEKAGLVGMLIGLTTLVRPGFLPWLGVSIGCLFFALRLSVDNPTAESDHRVAGNEPPLAPLGTRLLACIALAIGCAAAMLPWAARNASVTGHWVFTSLWSGPSLYDGLNPEATGASNMQFFEDDFVMKHMSEFEMNEHYKKKAIAFAAKNPAHAVSLALKKAVLFLSPIPNFAKNRGWVPSTVCVILWICLLATCGAGLKSQEWNVTGMVVMVGPLLLFLLVHMVFVGSVRYRLPLEFPLSVLGAIGWRNLILKRGQSSQISCGETLTDETSK